jgi:hypothetical protein
VIRKSLVTLIPLVAQFLKPEADSQEGLETTFGHARKFGSMRLEAVEFI